MAGDDDPDAGTRYYRAMNTPDIRICVISAMPACTARVTTTTSSGPGDCAPRHGARDTTLPNYKLGVRRETSANIARRWQTECAARRLSSTQNHVVPSFGTNDVNLVDGWRRVAETSHSRQPVGVARDRQAGSPHTCGRPTAGGECRARRATRAAFAAHAGHVCRARHF